MSDLSAGQIIALLGLTPLPHEGGMWAQTRIDAHSSGIYFLLRPGDSSQLHRLGGPETWHYYAGAPVQMVLLPPEGPAETPVLHNRITDGSRPQIQVEAGVAMGAYTTGDWSLVGTTMAPPYDPDTFELIGRSDAVASHPEAVNHLDQVTS